MDATYNPWLVGLSVVVAMVVAYTALKLAARVSEGERSGTRIWLAGGALAMGIGIWSMHFIGMLAYSVDTPLRYGIPRTVISLMIAVVTSGFALWIVSAPKLSVLRLSAGALMMGAGISSMHYSGMSAIQITPIITYASHLVAASIVIAVVASFAALWLAFRLRSGSSLSIAFARAGAAIIMGLAISGMHYTGMAATEIAVGSICFGGATLDNNWMAGFIGITALGVLALTLITAVYDSHLLSRTRKDATRLAKINAELEHGKNVFALATNAAGISSWEIDLRTGEALWVENQIAAVIDAGIDLKRDPRALVTATHPDDRTNFADAIRAAKAAGRDTCDFGFRIAPPDGPVIHLHSHGRVKRDAQGRALSVLGVSWDVTREVHEAAQRSELELQFREASRTAGMAEVATGVLHNVGNVLNSLGVSAALLQARLRTSKSGNVQRVATLLEENRADLPAFLASERGREIPNYLAQLGAALSGDTRDMLAEIDAIVSHVGHIRNIVAAQQTYAMRGGATERVDLVELLDSAVAIHFAQLAGVEIRREYEPLEPLMLDRHKLLQIFGNLLSNARHALRDQPEDTRRLTLRLRRVDDASVAVEVQDSGCGMTAESQKRLFEFGYTTKKDGHGFGLHTCAILAKELDGGLRAFSDGPGQGARFELTLAAPAAEALKSA
jgi:NO-binding membrane sensor protein with MHYT domain/signal transduction histidine kinase